MGFVVFNLHHLFFFASEAMFVRASACQSVTERPFGTSMEKVITPEITAL